MKGKKMNSTITEKTKNEKITTYTKEEIGEATKEGERIYNYLVKICAGKETKKTTGKRRQSNYKKLVRKGK